MHIDASSVTHNLMGDISLPQIEERCRKQAERVVGFLICDHNYATWQGYTRMAQLDRWIMVEYWKRYCNMPTRFDDAQAFSDWFVSEVTDWTMLERACRALRQHGILIAKAEVQADAIESERKWRGEFGRR